ncbi:hypothetical protein LTR37_001530 [Vermiconidia calcicola]|uniref:Uncharacterized protein n=1 Tax=Vermiconidia calcicola TaxID=1690605 RepID=A0ACC3NWW9_9PEZI|nr:hypothetical protein LTR37_001530 [Vermiconidia calcicola]
MSNPFIEYSYGIPPGHRDTQREWTDLNTKVFIELAQDKDAEIAKLQSYFLPIERDKALIKVRAREFSRGKRQSKKRLAKLQADKRRYEAMEAERQQTRVTTYKSYLDTLAEAKKDRAQLSDFMLTTLPIEILLQVLAQLACQDSERPFWDVRSIKQESKKVLELLAFLPSIDIRGKQSSLSQLLEPFIEEAVFCNTKISFVPCFRTPARHYRVPYQRGFDSLSQQIRVMSLHFRGADCYGIVSPDWVYEAQAGLLHLKQWFPCLVELGVRVNWSPASSHPFHPWYLRRDGGKAEYTITDVKVRRMRAAVFALGITCTKFAAGPRRWTYDCNFHGSYDWS